MFPETVTTDSLELRRLSGDALDAVDLYGRFAEDTEGADGVFAYVPQEPYATPGEAHASIAAARTAWEGCDQAEYAVYPSGDTLAGRAVLVTEFERRTGRLGVILARPFWGEGYAVECALALTDLAFEGLDLELVEIGHESGNDRSKRAIEKYVDAVGGRYDGVVRNWTPVGDEVLDHHRYTVTREEYRGSRADSQ